MSMALIHQAAMEVTKIVECAARRENLTDKGKLWGGGGRIRTWVRWKKGLNAQVLGKNSREREKRSTGPRA